jgi:antibiotic biosynthesis monooxygenase (ABM) superfamily enzyme
VPYFFDKNSCFRYGPAWKDTLLLLMHYLLFIACFMLILLCIKTKYPFFIIVFADTVNSFV